MNEVLAQLDKQTIDSTAIDYVETITLAVDTNDYIHGFKIYYDDTWRPYNARYWRSTWLASDSKHRHYKDWQITPSDLERLLAWKEDKAIVIVATTREKHIRFPKDPSRGVMTEL